jgi:hypothetical protein
MERFVAGSLISAELPVNLPEVDLPLMRLEKVKRLGQKELRSECGVGGAQIDTSLTRGCPTSLNYFAFASSFSP